MEQYLEHKDKKSAKFWHINLAGTSFTVRYGKLGTKGRESKKTFKSKKEAEKEFDKLIEQKIKKGYYEKSTDPKSALKENEVRSLMTLFDEKFTKGYLGQRKYELKSIDDFEEDAKNYYLDIVKRIDSSFNSNPSYVKKGINDLLKQFAKTAPAEKPIQLLSFWMMDSSDHKIMLVGFEKFKKGDHSQHDYHVHEDGRYEMIELDQLFSDIFYSDHAGNYDLEDLFRLGWRKKREQISRCIIDCINEFDFTLLNIKYPLYIYVDVEESVPGSGTPIAKIKA